MHKANPVLSVRNLVLRYGKGCIYCLNHNELDKSRCPKCHSIWAVNDISFDLYPGEILGVVGESGSGKSTMLKSLYFDQEVTLGEAYINQYKNGTQNIFQVSSQQKRFLKNNLLGMVYQYPSLGLRMSFSSGGNIAEKLISAGNRHADVMLLRAKVLLERVEISTKRIKDPPKNFSGGMQQRVQISKAIANNPPILLLDEVTTGLDLSVQARVLDFIKELQRELNISMLIVSHDLSVIRMMADRTIVMLDGKIVEEGITDQVLEDPHHAYTQILVNSLL